MYLNKSTLGRVLTIPQEGIPGYLHGFDPHLLFNRDLTSWKHLRLVDFYGPFSPQPSNKDRSPEDFSLPFSPSRSFNPEQRSSLETLKCLKKKKLRSAVSSAAKGLQDIKKQLHVNDTLAKQYAQHLNEFEAGDSILGFQEPFGFWEATDLVVLRDLNNAIGKKLGFHGLGRIGYRLKRYIMRSGGVRGF